MTVELLIQGLRDQVASDVLPRCADIVEETALEVWPSPDHPENVYATGRSRRAWRQRVVSPVQINVENPVDYTVYTAPGTTRAGPGTARPWAARGSVDYREQIVTAAEEKIRRELPGLVAEVGND